MQRNFSSKEFFFFLNPSLQLFLFKERHFCWNWCPRRWNKNKKKYGCNKERFLLNLAYGDKYVYVKVFFLFRASQYTKFLKKSILVLNLLRNAQGKEKSKQAPTSFYNNIVLLDIVCLVLNVTCLNMTTVMTSADTFLIFD